MARRLRIAFYAPGASIHTRRWVEGLQARGHDILLISQGRPGQVAVPVYDPFVEMGFLARLPKLRGIRAAQLIRRHLTRWRPDVTHLHWLNPTAATLKLCRSWPRLVISVWGRDLIWEEAEPEPRRRRLCKQAILESGRVVTATSEFLAERTRPFLRSDQPLVVVPFGVDCERFRPVPRPPSDVPVIGYLKHYAPKYGPHVLLKACSLLIRAGVPFRLDMYGTEDPGPTRALAQRLGLDDRARIFGSVDHERVPETLRGFDLYVMPSVLQSESFGVAALEASACGVPVVASRVGGVPETVRDGVTGRLVPPDDPEALAEALRDLLGDAALRARMARAGRDHVVTSYRWDDCLTRMEDVYRRLVGSETRARTVAAR